VPWQTWRWGLLVRFPGPRTAEKDGGSRRALLEAVRAADADRVRRLLRQGADVNARGEDGTTALMQATAVADIRLVRMLLEHGADVNGRNRACQAWACQPGQV
jgi:ankyrin repeat protein